MRVTGRTGGAAGCGCGQSEPGFFAGDFAQEAPPDVVDGRPPHSSSGKSGGDRRSSHHGEKGLGGPGHRGVATGAGEVSDSNSERNVAWSRRPLFSPVLGWRSVVVPCVAVVETLPPTDSRLCSPHQTRVLSPMNNPPLNPYLLCPPPKPTMTRAGAGPDCSLGTACTTGGPPLVHVSRLVAAYSSRVRLHSAASGG